MAKSSPRNILDAEIIYGAMRRERLWQFATVALILVAGASLATASFVVMTVRPPAPIVVPFDPATGMAVPNAMVESISLDERTAVVQALAYQYIQDRETYNQIDNDLRINRAIARSKGAARNGLIRLWDSGESDNLPDRYGDRTQVEVLVTSITILNEGRLQIRMRKRLTSPDGDTVGNFSANLGYEFEPGEERTLEAVWQNPLGFTVTEYAIFADRGS